MAFNLTPTPVNLNLARSKGTREIIWIEIDPHPYVYMQVGELKRVVI